MSNKLPVRGAEVLRALLEEDELASSDFARGADVTTNAYNYTFYELEEMDLVEIIKPEREGTAGNVPNKVTLTDVGREVAKDLDEYEQSIIRVQNSEDKIEELADELDRVRHDVAVAKDRASSGGGTIISMSRDLDELEDRIDDLEAQFGMISLQEYEHRGMQLQRIRELLEEEIGKTVKMCGRCMRPEIADVGANGQAKCARCGSKL